ncbi:DUF4255 domain-containing protein [Streptomyces echinatus]|uniref:Pvc16 N-terminal domain-containing protein n=1 Tax=Streptomyces echinatus TaxID=67293 RepID=A0A7W9PUP4_9ACTN|nr:DUF4255 domain-containing protein [Streptomyces echinatus]MBB5928279.1 hypothetical protein [Streptomyces echinatus]
MLDLLDRALESFLRAKVPLGKDVAIAFEAPDRDWVARTSGRPTVNLYLWDVRRNVEQREGGMEVIVDADGRKHRRRPLPRVDCRYLITAFTSDVRDEHALLGRVMATLLLHHEIGTEHLPGSLRELRPLPSVEIAAGDGQDNSDFWSALGGQLKPGLDVLVTTTVDAALVAEAAPDVHRYVIRTAQDGVPVGERELVAGRIDQPEGSPVVTPRGTARVSDKGTFLVPGRTGDEVSGGPGEGVVPERGPVTWSGGDDDSDI